MSRSTATSSTTSSPTPARRPTAARPGRSIDAGLPDGAVVHAVREDPARRGLLYAGTEKGVFVSFDDGAHWQTLQLNLPRSPVHDLVVKGDDLVVATHGRAVLDPRRRDAAAADRAADRARQAVVLYTPQTAHAAVLSRRRSTPAAPSARTRRPAR